MYVRVRLCVSGYVYAEVCESVRVEVCMWMRACDRACACGRVGVGAWVLPCASAYVFPPILILFISRGAGWRSVPSWPTAFVNFPLIGSVTARDKADAPFDESAAVRLGLMMIGCAEARPGRLIRRG